MGIETVAIIGAIAAAAGTGAQVSQSRDAARDTKDTRREQAYRAGQQQTALDEARKANDATAAARLARMRQRAMLASSNGNDQTRVTGPLGLNQTAAAPAGPQPLRKLGA